MIPHRGGCHMQVDDACRSPYAGQSMPLSPGSATQGGGLLGIADWLQYSLVFSLSFNVQEGQLPIQVRAGLAQVTSSVQ